MRYIILTLASIYFSLSFSMGFAVPLNKSIHNNLYSITKHAIQSADADTVQMIVADGWNLISLPLMAPNARVNDIFPSAISNAFIYDGSYVSKDTLQFGKGYWLKFATAETISVVGTFLSCNTISLLPGWNMIGALSGPFDTSEVTTNPINILRSYYYCYNSVYGYIAVDSLLPGKGYWVKVSEGGTLNEVSQYKKAPILYSPLDGITMLTAPNLRWNTMICANGYRLQVASDSLFTNCFVDTSVTDTAYPFQYHCANAKYFWRVGVPSTHEPIYWSTISRFTWAYPDSGLVSPDDSGGVSLTPYFVWRRAGCATSYNLQIANDSLFLNRIVDSMLVDTIYQSQELDSAATYYWRIRLSSNGVPGLWTTTHNFIVAWKCVGLKEEIIREIVFHPTNPNIIYAGGYTLFRTTNAGASWDTLLRSVDIYDLDIDPTNGAILYVTSGYINPGIFKTTDSGNTWQLIDATINYYPEELPRVLAIDPKHTDTLYMGTAEEGTGRLFKSTNGGQTWLQLLYTDNICDVEVDPINTQDVYLSIARCDLYKSTNGGLDWTSIACIDTTLIEITLHPSARESLFAGTNHGFFISGDSGISWQVSNEGLIVDSYMRVTEIRINPINPSHILINYITFSKGNGIYKSINNGSSWQRLPYSFYYYYPYFDYPIYTVKITPDGMHLYAGLLSGIYKFLFSDL